MTAVDSDPIVWIDGVDVDTAVRVTGSKMGRLSELHLAGANVPDAFSVATSAYRAHVVASGLDTFASEVIDALGPDPAPDAVERASETIRSEFERRPIGEDLAGQIRAAYQELCLRCVEVNVPVAVRSSATGEDSSDASFAGIFDTYLGISGEERVLDAVRRCWASLFTGRALDYRLRRGISHLEMPMAVGVVKLVHARCSGVAFSAHPVTGKRDRVVIEGSWGWGEAVVQGLVTPDHVEVGKTDRRVLRYDVSHKTIVSAFDYSIGAVVEIDMPDNLADRAILDEEEIGEITRAVLKVEEHYGYPVDVEWVLDRHHRPEDSVSIVQARPVTVSEPEPVTAPAGWDPVAMAAKHAFGSTSG